MAVVVSKELNPRLEVEADVTGERESWWKAELALLAFLSATGWW